MEKTKRVNRTTINTRTPARSGSANPKVAGISTITFGPVELEHALAHDEYTETKYEDAPWDDLPVFCKVCGTNIPQKNIKLSPTIKDRDGSLAVFCSARCKNIYKEFVARPVKHPSRHEDRRKQPYRRRK